MLIYRLLNRTVLRHRRNISTNFGEKSCKDCKKVCEYDRNDFIYMIYTYPIFMGSTIGMLIYLKK